MVIISLELMDKENWGSGEKINSFQIHEISRHIRNDLRKLAENMLVLEDMGHEWTVNEYSVDCELPVENERQAKEYLEKTGLDPDDFDYVDINDVVED
jgi:hypothetical protein